MAVIDTPYDFAGRFELSRRYIGPSGDMTGIIDATAITAAVSMGGKVELGPGNFYIAWGIPVGVSNTHIVGQGRDVTILNYVGPANTYNTIEMAPGITKATEGTSFNQSGHIDHCSIENLSIYMGSTLAIWQGGGASENVNMGIKVYAAHFCFFRNLFIKGAGGYGYYCLTGSALGLKGDSGVTRDNIFEDCECQVDGQNGFYDDSINAFAASGNPLPNRDNIFLNCRARNGTLGTSGSFQGFFVWGTVGTKFTSCHAEGIEDSAHGSAGFYLTGNATGTEFVNCSTLECDAGYYITYAVGTRIVNHSSWFDANFALRLIGDGVAGHTISDLVVYGLTITDIGISGQLSGYAINVFPKAGNTFQRIRIQNVRNFLSGVTTSPIFGVQPALIGTVSWNQVGTISQFELEQVQFAGTTFFNLTAGTLAGLLLINCRGLQPFIDNRGGLTSVDGIAIKLIDHLVYPLPAGTLCRVTIDIYATAFTSGTATYTLTWTENAQSKTLVVTATAINVLGTASDLINPDTNTDITVQLTGVFTATVKVAALVEQLA